MGWWSEQPWWLRYGIAFGLIIGSSYMFFVARVFGYRSWAAGTAVGIGLLVIGGPSDSEKNGYHF